MNYLLQGILLGILIALIVSYLFQKNFQRKLNSLQSILIDKNDPDLFIEENTKLLDKTKSPYNQSLIYINISAGHAVKKSYRKSKEALNKIPVKGLKGINRLVYYSNLAYYHFKLAEVKEAIKIVEDNKKDFDLYQNHSLLGRHIKLNQVYYLKATKETEKAKELLEKLKTEYTDEKFLKELSEVKL